jgi:hypothetical protein
MKTPRTFAGCFLKLLLSQDHIQAMDQARDATEDGQNEVDPKIIVDPAFF